MNEAFVIERDFLFKENIFEITSISIEHEYDINGEKLEGDFGIPTNIDASANESSLPLLLK